MFRKALPTILDQMIEECQDQIAKAQSELEASVVDVITKVNVIALYPDGPDKEKAKKNR